MPYIYENGKCRWVSQESADRNDEYGAAVDDAISRVYESRSSSLYTSAYVPATSGAQSAPVTAPVVNPNVNSNNATATNPAGGNNTTASTGNQVSGSTTPTLS